MNNIQTKILLILSVGIVGTTMLTATVNATNNNGAWDHNNVTYNCNASGMTTTTNVDICGDVSSSKSELEKGSLTLTASDSGEIILYGWTSGIDSSKIGKAVTTYNSNNVITDAYLVMNKNKSFEDSTVDTTNSAYDWKSAVIHELGHNVGLAHYTSSGNLMYSSLSVDTTQRSLSSHSSGHISNNYT